MISALILSVSTLSDKIVIVSVGSVSEYHLQLHHFKIIGAKNIDLKNTGSDEISQQYRRRQCQFQYRPLQHKLSQAGAQRPFYYKLVKGNGKSIYSFTVKVSIAQTPCVGAFDI